MNIKRRVRKIVSNLPELPDKNGIERHQFRTSRIGDVLMDTSYCFFTDDWYSVYWIGRTKLFLVYSTIGRMCIQIKNNNGTFNFVCTDGLYSLLANEDKSYYIAGCRYFSRDDAKRHWGSRMSSLSIPEESRKRAKLFYNAIMNDGVEKQTLLQKVLRYLS